MVDVADVVGLLVILGLNTAFAALATRFFRVRLHTDWGSAIYVVLLTPVPLLVSTLILSGVLGLGPDLGSAYAVLAVTIGLPMAVGVAFDFFWMPDPEDVELPEPKREQRAR
jgi:hypothetical protein